MPPAGARSPHVERLADGALLLLDGVNEVPNQRRDEIRASIGRYMELYDRCQFIVTSRPPAVRAPGWEALFGARRASVRPMAPVDIERFVERWHEALRRELRDRRDEPAPDAAAGLSGRILATPALAQLAETPLLCAAVCYLHRVNRGELPRRAWQLYEELVRQLVHRLDEQRLRREGADALFGALRGLDRDEKIKLLARLAHLMVREQESALEVARALPQVTDELERLRKLDGRDPGAVLEALQERGGVLRGASEREVEFAHDALKGYLAALIFKGERSTRELVDKAFATAHPDLPVLAAALGDDECHESLTRSLMTRAGEARRRRRASQVMAVRCGHRGALPPALNRELARLRAEEVFPPRDLEEARQLAELGEDVVPLVARRGKRSAKVDAACVRALRLIGGPLARAALEACLDHDAEEVADGLPRALNPLRVRAIRAVVGGTSNFWRAFAPLRHLKSRDPAELPASATSLNLRGASVDTAGLSRLAGLRQLFLDDTQAASNDLAITALRARGVVVHVF